MNNEIENKTKTVEPIATTDEECSYGFDIIPTPSLDMTVGGWMPYSGQRDLDDPHPILSKLYAKLGLHRYNMLKGTSFEFDSLVKLNMRGSCVASCYLTFLAHDPASGSLQKTFVLVEEQRANTLDLVVSIARTKYKEPIKDKDNDDDAGCIVIPKNPAGNDFLKDELPDWPSDDALNDGKRFYVVKESEWQAIGWISLYLKLLICANNKYTTNKDFLSKLEILKVVIETSVEDVEPLNERLSANVYIMFKGLREFVEIDEHVEHKAIVRRVIDECRRGGLSLVGKIYGGKLLPLPFGYVDGEPIQNSKKQIGFSVKPFTVKPFRY